ncbi:MAG: response regulator transcription factor [Akkermansiaceae bacterium]|nr:response regulator transcription factor [Akkermansiaceae bacterium]
MPIRLMLADDHSIVLMGLKAMLEDCPDIEVVATAENGREALAVHSAQRPDVLLLDLRMPDMPGDEVARTILRSHPAARIIILTTYDLEADIRRAFDAGVAGYLLKETKLPDLLRAIRAVNEGRTWFPEDILRSAEVSREEPELSTRQVEVLELVARGLSNKEIAGIFGFSENGTKQHLRRIFTKLGAATRTEAVSAGLNRGILRGW